VADVMGMFVGAAVANIIAAGIAYSLLRGVIRPAGSISSLRSIG